MRYRRVASFLGVSVALAGSVIGTAGEASAYPQVNVCGSSYGSLKQYPVRGTDNTRVGWIDTYYSSATGKNCAIVRGDDSRASGFNHIEVAIGLSGAAGWTQTDGAGVNYTKYAGPVYVYAPGNTCIDVWGVFKYGDDGFATDGALGVRC
ncbi:hypothetical protein ACFWBF_09535 [Streptomyces sp. NPDC060028]|nr:MULTISPECIES: hypothetical protein [unclassified Streptomyces]MCX5078543.1 hypothetical protein [Streptomyces sp. NBC_00424]MCY0916572.1 hypothetical protein [Streptomyces sp. H27-G5]MCY0958373.1 hypothetical protein [Streptomyces sp. H27-H5]